MANSQPPMDNVEIIKRSLKAKRYCQALPVAAITKSLAGRKLVNLDKIRP